MSRGHTQPEKDKDRERERWREGGKASLKLEVEFSVVSENGARVIMRQVGKFDTRYQVGEECQRAFIWQGVKRYLSGGR